MKKVTRFSAYFFILILILSGYTFSQTSIEVTPDQGLRNAILYASKSNIDTLILATSGGVYAEVDSFAYQISSPLVIMAKPGLAEKPILTNEDTTGKILQVFNVSNSLTLEGVVLDGKSNKKYGITVQASLDDGTAAADGLNLIVKNCDFKDFYTSSKSDGHAVYFYKDVHAGKVDIEDCTINGTGYEAIRMSETEKYATPRALDTLIVRNCTFQNVDAECVRVYGDKDTSTTDAYIFLEHLTIDHCNTRAFYIKDNKNTILRDCIITNDYVGSHGRADYTAQIQFDGSEISNMDAYNLSVDDFQATKGGVVDSSTIYNFDPMYKDSTNGDFTLMKGSPAYGKAHDGTALGDLRWAKFATAVEKNDINAKPNTYSLSQNYPNPFNPSTTISFSIQKASHVKLVVYNVLGKVVQTLINENMSSGSHSVNFNASGLSSGIYFYSIQANNFTSTKKMILLK